MLLDVPSILVTN